MSAGILTSDRLNWSELNLLDSNFPLEWNTEMSIDSSNIQNKLRAPNGNTVVIVYYYEAPGFV